jgi:NADH-quinone oxidoreductase subunit H
VISYEIPLGMSALGVVLLSSTLDLEKILMKQAEAGIAGWNVWVQPLACLIFFTSSLAESNRLPFDLSECEQELVGGYHTEYGGLRMVLFFIGEYTHITTISFLTVILFFGGWHFPGIATPESTYAGAWVVKVLVLLTKVMLSIFLIMLIRWTIPRFRFDQLMELTWKVFIPLTLLNVLAVMTVLQFGWDRWWLLPISLGLFVLAAGAAALAKRADLKRRRRGYLATA